MTKFVKGHKLNIGEKHPQWKGGVWNVKNGYRWIRCVDHPKNHKGYVKEQVLVMEKHLGRYLKKGEEIHHINFDKHDNRLDNLFICNHSTHQLAQSSLFKMGLELALNEFNKGNIVFDKEEGIYKKAV